MIGTLTSHIVLEVEQAAIRLRHKAAPKARVPPARDIHTCR